MKRTNFLQQRPALAVAGILAGAFLLDRYWRLRQRSAFEQPQSIPISHAQPLPSARLGAREDQVLRLKPSTTSDVGSTGAAYDLDPGSISPG